MKTEHPASSLFHLFAHLLQQRLGRLHVLEVDGKAYPGGRAVCGVILRPLHRWDRGYESRRIHGLSSAVFVLCSVGSGLSYELITLQEESYRVYVCV